MGSFLFNGKFINYNNGVDMYFNYEGSFKLHVDDLKWFLSITKDFKETLISPKYYHEFQTLYQTTKNV